LKNLFITGASSYLGRNLLKALNGYNIFALKNSREIELSNNINVISHLPKNLNNFFNEYKIEYIVHLATNSNRDNEILELESIVSTNIELGLKIQKASISSSVKKIISAGTYNQDVIINPQSAYAISKECYEKFQKFFSTQFFIKNTSIHFGDIYGPNDCRNKLIPYIKKHENDECIEFNSDGNSLFSPVYIEDAVSAIIDEFESTSNHSFMSKIVASDLITVKEFIDLYKQIRKKNFKCKFLGNTKHDYIITKDFYPSKNLKFDLVYGLSSI
jgi:nucleoside-diphosphate-sugar epimerase